MAGRALKRPRDNKSPHALLGQGPLTSDGDAWRRQRNLAQPAFHRRQLGALVGTLADATAEIAARWERCGAHEQPVDVSVEMGRLKLAIVTRALYGLDASDQAELVSQSLSRAIRHTAQALDRVVY